jgi:tetratricopeptide (TPR) repeat protein
MALERPAEAAVAAGEVIAHYPSFKLVDQARLARAEALLARRAYDEARNAFHELGTRAKDDQERLQYLLREADCLEAGRRYDDELALLNDAIAHERPPVRADTTGLGKNQVVQPPVAGSDGFGRLLLRIGTARLLAGHMEEALQAYRRVTLDYARSGLAAEAQYRIGYAYETAADDFEKARAEYSRVRDHGGAGGFIDQASERLGNLDRLAQFRTSGGGDSTERKAESGFLLAELYLFQLEKPERALEEYRKIASDFTGTPIAAKAMNAQAWVLSRKLERKVEADSLFWAVVNEYPKTEAQLAARDYLEFEGVSVPENLIQAPEPKYAHADSVPPPELPPVPTALGPLPQVAPSPSDSLRLGPHPPGLVPPQTLINPPPGPPTATGPRPSRSSNPPPAASRSPAPSDTLHHGGTARDSSNVTPPQPGTPTVPPADSTKTPK